MNFRTFLTAYALYLFAYGLPSLLVPGPLLAGSYIALVPDPSANLLTRYWGAISVGFGLLIWRVRNLEDAALQRSLATAIFLIEGLNVLLTVIGIVTGLGGVALWGASAVVHLLFALSAGSFLLRLR